MNKDVSGAERNDVPLVAIGASAGGLEPLEQFFKAVPENPGIAFVVVQHLSPDYRSMMNELLARKSNMPIHHIEDEMRVEPNTVYLNRPNMYVELEGDTFRTLPYPVDERLPHLPIDRFFTSLSSRDWNRTVAVVLSGSGSDGAHGAQILFEAGAAVLVQSVKEASFSSMPKAVLLSGSVDRVLDAAEMPMAIQDIFAYGKQSSKHEIQVRGQGIQSILKKLEDRHKVDFSCYKPGNVNRRIVRRLHLRGYASLEEYNEILGENDEALNELFHDMLIGVTEFYRDRDAIKTLRTKVLDVLAAQPDKKVPIKIWVPGCASGEEVYTIAIELSEALREAGNDRRFRIIGTDIHAGSIEIASQAVYSAEKLKRVPEQLRRRYFVETHGQYMVDPGLRQKIIFSIHNLISDPPFMNLDLISCRNLMIYLNEEPQASAISMFIFGLQQDGYLFLGASETIGKFRTGFEVINARWRIFQKSSSTTYSARTSLANRSVKGMLPQRPREGAPKPSGAASVFARQSDGRTHDLLIRSYDSLLKRYAPSSILLTSDGKVLNWFGQAATFIDTMNNLADWTVQEIVHSDLHFAINVGVEKLRQGQFKTHVREITVTLEDRGPVNCKVSIEALDKSPNSWLILARIEVQAEAAAPQEPADPLPEAPENAVDDDVLVLTGRIHSLERDLRLTEETLQHVTERLEASSEELQASNEELQASNEELQASNEELQSSNEELHAVNEELVSVSAEHERKIEILSELNENTEVILKSMKTGVIVLDNKNCIRRFSQLIERDFSLQEHDIGRSISVVGPRLDFVDIRQMAQGLADDPAPRAIGGIYEGRNVTVRAIRCFLGPVGERVQGAIIMFLWD